MPSRGRGADGGRTPPRGVAPIERAFDALRFGPDRTLNLRDDLPTTDQATRRVEAWLRQKQAEGVREVLVVTGRGLGSLDGVGRVREAVRRHLTTLKRFNIVETVVDHSPGSCVVTLLPFRAVVEAPRLRKGARTRPPVAIPDQLAALAPATRDALHALALAAIERLGVRAPSDTMIADEMLSQFAALASALDKGVPDRDAALREMAEHVRWQIVDEL
jgi:hypothetical protein